MGLRNKDPGRQLLLLSPAISASPIFCLAPASPLPPETPRSAPTQWSCPSHASFFSRGGPDFGKCLRNVPLNKCHHTSLMFLDLFPPMIAVPQSISPYPSLSVSTASTAPAEAQLSLTFCMLYSCLRPLLALSSGRTLSTPTITHSIITVLLLSSAYGSHTGGVLFSPEQLPLSDPASV